METAAGATFEQEILRKKLKQKLLRKMGKTIHEYELIQSGDRIMVAVSGGKDSLSMLVLLEELRKKAPVNFELFAYTLDQSQPGFDASGLKRFFEELEVEHHIITKDTYSVVTEKLSPEQTYCSLCSRLRRGILYTEARRLKANKIALGHHADDAIVTFLLNLFYTGRNASMPPALLNDEKDLLVIRPMIECSEAIIQQFSDASDFPVIPCNLCNSQDNLNRQRLSEWLQQEETKNPLIKHSMMRALKNLQPRHLWDKNFFPLDQMNPQRKDS